MKCERCGCEIGCHAAICLQNWPSKWKHKNQDDCIAALKAKLEEKFTGEPTKPERFAKAREFANRFAKTGKISTQEIAEILTEFCNLLAAFDEASVLLGNYIYPEFIKWRNKWK